jgi:hypothetical protein
VWADGVRWVDGGTGEEACGAEEGGYGCCGGNEGQGIGSSGCDAEVTKNAIRYCIYILTNPPRHLSLQQSLYVGIVLYLCVHVLTTNQHSQLAILRVRIRNTHTQDELLFKSVDR